MSDGGKGSAPRPYSVDQKTFDNNWDRIFGKKKEQSQPQSNTAPKNDQINSNNT